MELLDLFGDYIIFVVLGICLWVGYIIKHSLPMIPNRYIPLLIGLLGVILNIWVNQGEFDAGILLGGLTSGLASTGAHEFIRNLKKKAL